MERQDTNSSNSSILSTRSLRSMSRRRKWVALLVFSLILLVPLTSLLNWYGRELKESAIFDNDELNSVITLEAKVSAFDYSSQTLNMFILSMPSAAKSDLKAYTIKAGSKSVSYDLAFDSIPKLDMNLNILFANPTLYPLDRYETNVTILVTDLNKKPLPTLMEFNGGLDGWEVTAVFSKLGDVIIMDLVLTRSNTTKIFGLLIFLLTWALTIYVTRIAVVVWFRDYVVEAVAIGFTGSFLFSLPALRNSQPGAPVIGCISDTMGFLWCVGLVGFSMFSNMFNYIHHRPKVHKDN
ncbi:hypothetical protein BC833DRAFT_623630 [Globomyces pollinis-pini]|nr:hypothetical protein BC833DRAFT_623630 [Globomyces pollinis-pini]